MTLKDLKIGDPVFITYRKSKELAEVERITPKGFICVKDTLYDPVTGRKRGSSDPPWYPTQITVASPDAILEFTKDQFTTKILDKLHSLEALTYSQAVQINIILNLIKKEKR